MPKLEIFENGDITPSAPGCLQSQIDTAVVRPHAGVLGKTDLLICYEKENKCSFRMRVYATSANQVHPRVPGENFFEALLIEMFVSGECLRKAK